MKTGTSFTIALFITVLVVAVATWFLKPDPQPRQKVIDLPEEIVGCTVGDFVRVYKVTEDTVFLGFYKFSEPSDSATIALALK